MASVMSRCEVASAGLQVIDVKRLHRILTDELGLSQGSSTVAQRQLILSELQVRLTLFMGVFTVREKKVELSLLQVKKIILTP